MILVHLCKKCGHAQREHVHDPARLMKANRGFNPCTCCDRNAAPEFDPEPTPRETRLFTGGVEDHIYEPGSVRNPDAPPHKERLCACDACGTMYAALTDVPF